MDPPTDLRLHPAMKLARLSRDEAVVAYGQAEQQSEFGQADKSNAGMSWLCCCHMRSC